MKVALLDVNVLIALIDPSHEFHGPAHVWFQKNRKYGWATCPITENACVRILGKPSYPYRGLAITEIREILSEFCKSKDHHFWRDSVSLLDASLFSLSECGPKNITDLYLVALAIAERGRLATFDRKIRWGNVARAGADTLELIPRSESASGT